jgi:hypothetical protein
MKEKIRFDEFGPTYFMEDFHVHLSLLERGYLSIRIQNYSWDQRSSNSLGGVSRYRTPETMKATAETLHKAHPKVVEVVLKKSDNWVGVKSRR